MKNLLNNAVQLLKKWCGDIPLDIRGNLNEYGLHPISPDGSSRFFFRIIKDNHSLCVGVVPPADCQNGLAEALSCIDIGRHLHGKGVPIPRILAYDRDSGMVLFEDCGDCRLDERINNLQNLGDNRHTDIAQLYTRVVEILVHMQLEGAKGFEQSWCFDTPEYDRKVMIERESYYYLNEFWHGLLQGRVVPGVEAEFSAIASTVELRHDRCFLHRDLQSRNILVTGRDICIIDYQGGRIGPPGYDLASLLLDPYVQLPEELQALLLEYYCDMRGRQVSFDRTEFEKQYTFLRLQRNLQILGAFAFLSVKRKKPFFRQYIPPAVRSLAKLMENRHLHRFTSLRSITDEARIKIEKWK